VKKREFRITRAEGGTAFAVTVVPRAKRNEIVGRHGEAIKIRIAAPAEKGKANRALLRFLARKLGVKQSQLEIVAGDTSRKKLVSVIGLTPQEVEEKLLGEGVG